MQEEGIKKVKDGRKKELKKGEGLKRERRTERKKEFRGKGGNKQKSLLLALNLSG